MSHHPFYVHTLPGKIKTYILPWFMKCSSVHLTETLSNLNRISIIFAVTKPEKCTKQGMHLLIYYLKESVANDIINVSSFACCEPRHQRVEASSVGLSRRWRRSFWTLFIIATLKITMSKCSTVNFIIGDDFFCSLLLWT